MLASPASPAAPPATEPRGIASAPFVRGGRASYALYILHKPIYFWLARAFGVGLLPPSWFLALYIVVVVIVSVVAWRAIEEPTRRALVPSD